MGYPLLADAVDIRRWLDADAETPYETRVRRDRKVGTVIDAQDELARVLAWWRRLAPVGDEPTLGRRLVMMARLAVWLLVLLGLVLGLSLGAVAFAYDGTHPVNLLGLIGVLVGVPLVLLIVTLVLLLPVRIPGLADLRAAVGVINPGRWVGAWLDRYAGISLYGGLKTGRSRFARWQLVVFSQWLAAGYFAGVLLSGTVLVAVTDLAFGWSTTLDLDSGTVDRIFSFLALPWQGWLPSAVPDAALVEASRYYRLETVAVGAEQARALGGWWPFVLCTILFWGLLPRLVLLLVGRWRLTAATRALICQDPEVLALIDRLTPPRVDFGPEEASEAPEPSRNVPAPPVLDSGSRTGAIVWNDALGDAVVARWGAAHLGGAFGQIERISARMGTAARASAIDRLQQDLTRVVVFTKGWEPPLLEFGDFLRALRERLGDSVLLTVVPINTGADGVDAADRQVWASFLARRDDPRLYVQQAMNAPDGGAATTGGGR